MKSFYLILFMIGGSLKPNAQIISRTDSIQIVDKIEDWNRAWKIKDADLAAKWYSGDADFTNAFGFSMIGQKAINEYLSRVFKMDFVMSGVSNQTSLKMRALNEETVLVISTISRAGQKMSDNSELGQRRTTHHRLFQKLDDWQIIAHLISDARSIETVRH